nr:Abi family protein [Acetobacter sacchari]
MERFSRYLSWAGGDRQKAIDLYALNTRLSEALYVPLQMLEVALRNRVHAVLSDSKGSRWYETPNFLVGRHQEEQVAAVVTELSRLGKEATPGRVVAALTLSFWTTMVGKPYEDLWQTELYQIARHRDGKGLTRKHLSGPLTPIRILRNRIAHHEPILAWDLKKHHFMTLQITEWLSLEAADWCRSLDRFQQVFPSGGITLKLESG